MRSILQAGAVVAGLLVAAGCATQKATVWFSPEVSGLSELTYAILPFTDGNYAKHRLDYPQAAAVVASAFESSFLQTGQRVVSMGNEDVTLSGTVTAFYRGSFGGAYTTVGFDVKAVYKKKGAVLWKASHAKTTKYYYKYDPNLLAKEVAEELVEQLATSGKLR